MAQVILPSGNPVPVARFVVQALGTANRLCGVFRAMTQWVLWDEGRWRVVEEDKVRARIYEVLEDAWVQRPGTNGQNLEEYAVDQWKMNGVMDVLKGLVAVEDSLPFWAGDVGKSRGDARMCVPFLDRVVDLEKTIERVKARGGTTVEEGDWVTWERTEEWVGLSLVPAKWDPKATCPVYDEKARQWLPKEVARNLRDKMYGYLLQSKRHHARGLNEYGKPRSGKSTNTHLLALCKGDMYFGSKVEELARDFKSPALLLADTVVVPEANEMGPRHMGSLGSLLRSGLGGDRATADVKYMNQVKVRFQFAPVVQGHEILSLPDAQRGLSSKMLWLHFEESFLGKEDLELEKKLEAEIGGIALRWMKAYLEGVELEKDQTKWWQMDAAGEEMLRSVRRRDAWEAFFEDCTVEAANQWVSTDQLRRVMHAWMKEEGRELLGDRDRPLHENYMVAELVKRCPWKVSKARRKYNGPLGVCFQHIVRGIGLRLRKGREG